MSTANARTAGLSFLGGLLLGSAFIAPVLPAAIAALPSLDSLGAVGRALVAGMLSLVLFWVGMCGLYFAFLHLEES